MYDESLSILEDADYTADKFWLEGEEFEDSFPFGIDEEMSLVSIERAATLIDELSAQYDLFSVSADEMENVLVKMRDAARKATKDIKHFIDTYEKLREAEF